MNHSLWELSMYTRHRHDQLVAERRMDNSLSVLASRSALAAFRRTLGLGLIAAGRALAGADALREVNRPLRPAV